MVATYDSRPAVLGLVPSTEGAIPGDDGTLIPDGSDDAALADAEQEDAEDSAEPAPAFDIDTLDEAQRLWLETHYQSQYQGQFEQRLADAMRTRDRENNDLRSQKQQVESNLFALNAALGQAHQWLAQYAQQHGDELAYYQFRDATAGAMQGATQQQAQAQQSLVAWIANEHHVFNQKLAADSVGLDGQRLFDPNDQDIQTAFEEYARAAYRDRTQWQANGAFNPVANQEAAAAFERLDALKKRKMLGGVQSKAELDRQQKAKEAAAVARRRKERGPQSTARGAGGGLMNDDAAWEAAGKEYTDDPLKRHARYLQLKHGNPQ